MLDWYFSEESIFAIKLFASMIAGTETEVVYPMWEALSLILIFFFPLSVNPFLTLSVLNLGFWLFCAVRQLLCSTQSTAACSCSKSFVMQGILKGEDRKVCE